MKTTTTAFLSGLLLLAASLSASAQNCTVNAGVPELLCRSKQVALNGTVSGLYNPSSINWSQISGPSLGINYPGSISTNTIGLTTSGSVYSFRLTATCQDGNTVNNDITYTVATSTPAPPFHSNIAVNPGCVAWGQPIQLSGAVPPPGFTGTWKIRKPPAGFITTLTGNFSDVHDPNASFTPLQAENGTPNWSCAPTSSTYTLEWEWTSTIAAPPECPSAQLISTSTYTIHVSLYNAVDARNTCAGNDMMLYGTCPGSGVATWSLVSGPAGYTFSNVNAQDVVLTGLPGGSYTFRYTVTGCTNGSKDVSFNVAPAGFYGLTVSNANAGNIQTGYCDGFPASLQLSANAPNVGETGTWRQMNGASTAVFSDIHDPNAILTGLTASGGTYRFRWTIQNQSGCFSESDLILVVPQPITPYEINIGPSGCFNQFINTGSIGEYSCFKRSVFGALGINFAPFNFPSAQGWYLDRMNLTGKPAGSPAALGVINLVTYRLTPSGSGIVSTVADCNGVFAWYEDPGCGSISGCATRLINIGVHEPYLPGVYTGTMIMKNAICGTESIWPFKMNISAAPSLSNAGTDQNLACNVTQTFLAGNDPLATGLQFGKGTWSQISGPNTAVMADKSDRTTRISSLTPGTYSFLWRIDGGGICAESLDTVVVRVSNTPPAAVTAGPDKTVCWGPRIRLAANLVPAGNIDAMLLNTGSTGVWIQVSGPPASILSPGNPVTMINVMVPNSVYVFRYTATNLCGSTQADVTITTNNTVGFPLPFAGTDQCFNPGTSSFLLNASTVAGGTGVWTKLDPLQPGSFINPASSNTNYINATTNRVYGFIWTFTLSGCPNSSADTVFISNSGTSSVATARPNLDTCAGITGNTFQLYATPPLQGTGRWSQVSGPPGTTFNPLNASTQVTFIETGMYTFRWTVDGGPCGISSDDVQVNVGHYNSIAEILTPDTLLCNTSQFTLRAAPPLAGTGRWEFLSNMGGAASITNPDAANTTVIVNPGITMLRWTIAGYTALCPGSYKTITIEYNPPANAKADISLCQATNALLISSNPGNATGTWSVISQPPGSPVPAFFKQGNDSTYSISPLMTGVYNLRWSLTNAGACGNSFDDRVLTIDDVTAPDTGPDLCVVTGNAVTLTGSIPPVGTASLWSVLHLPAGAAPGAITNAAQPTTTYTPAITPGTYGFQYEFTNGACAKKDYLNIRAIPVVVANASALNYCDNLAGIDLTGNDPFPGSGSWSLVSAPPGGMGVVWTNQNTPNANVKNLTIGSYTFRYTITDAICGASFKDVTINSLCYTLPVTLTSFTASVQNCNTILKWASAEESGFKKYEVEQSRDGIDFTFISSVPAKGSYSQYSYTPAPASGTMYYRLKLVDIDNSYSYSSIITAINNCAVLHTRVYPAPADKTATVEIEGSTIALKARVFSTDGKLVKTLTLHNGRNSISTEGWSNGLYQLVIEGVSGNSEKHSLLVQH